MSNTERDYEVSFTITGTYSTRATHEVHAVNRAKKHIYTTVTPSPSDPCATYVAHNVEFSAKLVQTPEEVAADLIEEFLMYPGNPELRNRITLALLNSIENE